MGDYDVKLIERKARGIRRDILRMLKTQKGHLGGSMSMADIVAALYFGAMRFDPAQPRMKGRDRFILSKGHCVLAQYAALIELGLMPRDVLDRLKRLHSPLQGHPDMAMFPGLEANTGSLGQGLSMAIGMALAARLDGEDGYFFVVTGDGELSEGQVWEGAMAAVHYKLDRIILIVDNNGIQGSGPISKRFETQPYCAKFAGFGWNATDIDGHSIPEILTAIDRAKQNRGKPSAIVAHTVKGKGVSFAENTATFHHNAMNDEQYATAEKELGC
jgi:transketolase